jgi:hypothetical protein
LQLQLQDIRGIAFQPEREDVFLKVFTDLVFGAERVIREGFSSALAIAWWWR